MLSNATRRRLQNLPQIMSVWEGDRRPLTTTLSTVQTLTAMSDADADDMNRDCILWADGSQGMVRAMDISPVGSGNEAMVRILLRAMENPQGPCQPARPQKIVVRDRELQFFLRGVLQGLEIAIDCVPNLPLIDEVFRGFQEAVQARPPKLPPVYDQPLHQVAFAIWQDALWDLLEDHQIISVTLNKWDIETLYVSVMGKLGMEYGLLLYRSLESLQRFRSTVLSEEEPEHLEAAFLGQDCLFLTFDAVDDDTEEDDLDLATLPPSEIEPTFGNLHPLEGMRPYLYEEEAAAMWVCLESLHRFAQQYHRKLENGKFPPLSGTYSITLPSAATQLQSVLSVTVSTVPELAAEFLEMMEQAEFEDYPDDAALPPLQDDLIPDGALLSIGALPWETLDLLRGRAEVYQAAETHFAKAGDGLPVIMIQTSRPKAQTLIDEIQGEKGLKAIGFNPGEDPFGGDRYDLGILQTVDGSLHLFGEFLKDDPTHSSSRKKWNRRCKDTQGYCGLVIAKGATGSSRGNPHVRDMLALYEVKFLPSTEFGLGTLQMMPHFG